MDNNIENKLGRLLDLHPEKLISAEEFQQKKTVAANTRGQVAEEGNPFRLANGIKNIGSNFLLQEKIPL